jgi:hypothetical protein
MRLSLFRKGDDRVMTYVGQVRRDARPASGRCPLGERQLQLTGLGKRQERIRKRVISTRGSTTARQDRAFQDRSRCRRLVNTARRLGQDQLRSLHVRLGAHLLPPRRATPRSAAVDSHLWGSEAQHISAQLRDALDTHQLHVALYLGPHVAERLFNARLSGCGERVKIHSPA